MRTDGRRVYYVLFLIVCSVILINCQGGGGGGGSGGGSSGGSRGKSSGNPLCVGENCWIIAVIAIVVIIGGWICIFTCYCYYHKRNGRPKEINSKYVNYESYPRYTPIQNAFQTGIWSGRYYQHGSWHGPHKMHLSFDPHSMAVVGSGWDDVGEFEIDGIFSDRTQPMQLTKNYKMGTGNAAQNLGHSVFIQVTFKANLNRFEGKWYVQTKKYHGEDEFVLEFDTSIV